MTINEEEMQLESEEEAAPPVSIRKDERKIFTTSSDPTIKDLYDRF
jgi:hypothetical protein